MQPTLEQPVTEEGRWELDPGGAWILVEPSAEWLAERDAAPDPVDPNTDIPTGYVAVGELIAAIDAAPNTVAGIKAALRSLGGTP